MYLMCLHYCSLHKNGNSVHVHVFDVFALLQFTQEWQLLHDVPVALEHSSVNINIEALVPCKNLINTLIYCYATKDELTIIMHHISLQLMLCTKR